MTRYHDAFPAHELEHNSSKALLIDGKNILICNAGGEYYAVDNMCTHQRAELEGGRIRNCFISCPLHGVRFNLETGKPMGQLTNVPLNTYPLQVSDAGMLQVAV
ncbi:Rieske 2Fe-2S domain-containing protein [Aestuariicella hydrocarbonica]|uniref:Rieske 2Fe-2S domain-containing protein n=1 Tax=Pseudomaricurvus hydrocarbonicus TaxID=1470433 RepID=A0A9E5JWE8_9GAMM|nr:Rieske 2Fe-2S domain-containing protein [Aestuariicella hydrocarbonica]NHO66823.1 Rieske 2Fe-2S domain-containing protein [Aestuariicella hydrocarbonica]